MEPLYEVNDKYTFEVYEEFARVCTKKVSKINMKFRVLSILVLVLAGLCFFVKSYVIAAAFVFYAVCMPFLFKIMLNKSVKKAWESNKAGQNVDIHISFFESNYIMKTAISEMTVEYENLYRIVLSDKLIVLMTSRQQGICFQRSRCSEELLPFLHTVVPIEKWS